MTDKFDSAAAGMGSLHGLQELMKKARIDYSKEGNYILLFVSDIPNIMTGEYITGYPRRTSKENEVRPLKEAVEYISTLRQPKLDYKTVFEATDYLYVVGINTQTWQIESVWSAEGQVYPRHNSQERPVGDMEQGGYST